MRVKERSLHDDAMEFGLTIVKMRARKYGGASEWAIYKGESLLFYAKTLRDASIWMNGYKTAKGYIRLTLI